MSISVTWNGQSYILPSPNEVGWGSNLNDFFVALPAGALQKTGGSFTLSAETDFGATYGLKSAYYKSRTANVASAGQIRLANNSDVISWRNAANGGNLDLKVNASDQLTFNGNALAAGGTIADGTQYQLAYYASNGSSISGLTAITASKALTSDANGLPVASTTTATELGYVAGLSSAVQTQLDSKLPLAGGTMTGALALVSKTLTQRDAIGSPAAGMSIYDTTNSTVDIYDGAHWNSIQTPYNVKSYGATGDGITDDLAAFVAVLAVISTAKAELIIPTGTYVLSNSLTVPANVTLVFQSGAIVAPASGKTFTINGFIQAGTVRIFSGAGLIRGTAQFQPVQPEWWGAVGDGSADDVTPLRATMAFVNAAGQGTVRFSSKVYMTSAYLTIPSNCKIVGDKGATLQATINSLATLLYATLATNIEISGMTFNNDRTNQVGSPSYPLTDVAAIVATYSNSINVHDCTFLNGRIATVINDEGTHDVRFTNNYYLNCEYGWDGYCKGLVIANNVFETTVTTGAAIQIEPTTQAGININEADGNDVSWDDGTYMQALEVSVSGNTIRGGNYGIIVHSGSVGVGISNNHIANVVTGGINASHQYIKSLVITGNTVRNVTTNGDGTGNPWTASGAGITLGLNLKGGVVSNNSVEYCWVGIFADTQQRTIISGNQTQFNKTSGICLFGSTGCIVTNNLAYNNFLDRSSFVGNSGIVINSGSSITLQGNVTTDTNGYQFAGVRFQNSPTNIHLGLNQAVGVALGPYSNLSASTLNDVTVSASVPGFSPVNFANGFRLLGQRFHTGSAAPTTGTWGQGAFVFSTSPVEAGSAASKYVIIGWVCVSTGTPGTWLEMRTLTGN